MRRGRIQLRCPGLCIAVTVCIDHWAKPHVLISLDQLAAADGSNAIRCSAIDVEDRDLLVMTLRYLVSMHCQQRARS